MLRIGIVGQTTTKCIAKNTQCIIKNMEQVLYMCLFYIQTVDDNKT